MNDTNGNKPLPWYAKIGLGLAVALIVVQGSMLGWMWYTSNTPACQSTRYSVMIDGKPQEIMLCKIENMDCEGLAGVEVKKLIEKKTGLNTVTAANLDGFLATFPEQKEKGGLLAFASNDKAKMWGVYDRYDEPRLQDVGITEQDKRFPPCYRFLASRSTEK